MVIMNGGMGVLMVFMFLHLDHGIVYGWMDHIVRHSCSDLEMGRIVQYSQS